MKHKYYEFLFKIDKFLLKNQNYSKETSVLHINTARAKIFDPFSRAKCKRFCYFSRKKYSVGVCGADRRFGEKFLKFDLSEVNFLKSFVSFRKFGPEKFFGSELTKTQSEICEF